MARKPGKADSVVYLVRHGKAEDSHPLGDAARALTSDGRGELRALARELRKDMGLVGIATSPLVRAVQTGEILAETFDVDEVRVRAELSYPGASAKTIDALARELGDGWALVGHNPSMSEALAHMLGLAGEPPRFRKGAIAALVQRPSAARPWTLAWVVSPGRKKEKTL